MVAGAVALAGCNGAPSQAPVPPFGVVGSFTGAQWRAIQPTLGGPLAPRSANVCMSGRPACMRAVLAEMSARIAALGCSHLAPFATMYRQVSVEVRASVDARRFADPAYAAHLDAVFASLYFHALDTWRAGRRAAVPRAWRMAFSAAEHRGVTTFGDMLLGMNAHISRDLPYALASVGLRLGDGRDATADIAAVNQDIDRATAPMLAQIRARYGSVAPPPNLPNWLKPSQVPNIIAKWRLEALANARDLLAAHGAAERAVIETRIDANAALRALLIWRSTATADSSARDRYCAARL
jgi:hypothetical protein